MPCFLVINSKKCLKTQLNMKAQLKMIMLACAVAGSSLMLSSCGAQIQQRKGNSGKTGWAYNDPKWGGF